MANLSSHIDYTLLTATASETDIRKICEEAWIHQFKAVCVAPSYVPYVVEMMEFCPVRIEIATVIGFPFGYSTTATKIFEAKSALHDGASELEVVMNISRFKSMAYLSVREELKQLANLAHENNAILKVIIETAFLDSFDLYTACEICAESGADYLTTSTDIASPNADPEVIRKIRSILPDTLKIKASGGIKTREQALEMLEAGAARIGTSAAVNLVSAG
ncbi:deoxyribose-phosphate aldolase [Dyadobacter sp. CY326]|uniref:deoxyribose-phosphate aldolase n=1 Tax=Dyadobacter sp. CY326 TaxID=2907300 RepID=UPI001F1E4D64|nr:deoxyribose-phosphate aldolase [Dyadobacter sp. CY326]MCE7068336.1 deoxyribose-phosphate aldolase [Dyadobacter sp. CY326]